MKLTKELIETIRAKAEELELTDEYEYIGIRVQEQDFRLGEMLHTSHIWDDGEDTGEELNGVCTTNIDKLDMSARVNGEYYGDHLAIICGNRADYGEDYGELIIEDAIVTAIIA